MSSDEDENENPNGSDDSGSDDSGVMLSVAEIKKGLGLGQKDTTYRAESDSDDVEDLSASPSRRDPKAQKPKDDANSLDEKPKSQRAGPKPSASIDSETSQRLAKELRCMLCLSTLYKPVVTSCGHTFCRVCLCAALKNLTDDIGRFKCPSCRKQFCGKCVRRFAVHRALWSTIQLIYPQLVQDRSLKEEEAEFRKALAELNGQQQKDSDGSVLKIESFQLSKSLKLNRKICRDPNDYVMHHALSVLREPDPLPDAARYSGNEEKQWPLKVAILELEEDEDEQEGGFPVLMTEDVDDRALLKNYDGDVQLKVLHLKEGSTVATELGTEEEAFADGVAKFAVNLPANLEKGYIRLEFQVAEFAHCSCYLEFTCLPESERVDEDEEGEGDGKSESVKRSKYFDIPRPKSIGIDGPDTDDEEDEELSEYEDDGFVVNDDEPIEVEGGSSDEDDEDDDNDNGHDGEEELDRDDEDNNSDSDDEVIAVSPDKDASRKSRKKGEGKRRLKRTISDDDSDLDSSDDANPKTSTASDSDSDKGGDDAAKATTSASTGGNKRRKIIDDDDDE